MADAGRGRGGFGRGRVIEAVDADAGVVGPQGRREGVVCDAILMIYRVLMCAMATRVRSPSLVVS